MKLRSGKEYNHIDPLKKQEILKKKQEILKKFVEYNVISVNMFEILKQICIIEDYVLLILVLNRIKTKHKYLSAKQGYQLMRNYGKNSFTKARYILPYILDQWNITRLNNFSNVEVICYFKELNIHNITRNNVTETIIKYYGSRNVDTRNYGYYGTSQNYSESGYECL
tara:strand:+ start:94 stop:597 length:504 start_codon:yes stop_codon:yes gene_type:complete